ncbi:hypothetical protein, partial [Bacillus toyonensis]|uniref:hypothetical protein n=1 Tax=Bacillus toyonensis TaxID=155322 RepID=UPI001CB8CB8B
FTNFSVTFISVQITLNDVYFFISCKFNHRKTAPPIVRRCLTIGVQFKIRSFLFILLFSGELYE